MKKKSLLFSKGVEEVHFQDVLHLCQGEEQEMTLPQKNVRNSLLKMAHLLGEYQDQITRLQGLCSAYDSKTGVKANGYRSFVKVAANFVSVLTVRIAHIKKRGMQDLKQLESLVQCLEKLTELNAFVLEIQDLHPGKLFPEHPDVNEDNVKDLSMRIALSDFSVFYGSTCGFHYGSDFRRLAKPMVAFLATFADVYEEQHYSAKLKKLVHSLFGIRYAVDSDLVTKKLSVAIREQPVEFTKTFFNMSEMDFLHRRQFAVGSRSEAVKTNSVIEVPLERMMVLNNQGAAFQVPIPDSSASSRKPLRMRLISPFRTPEMIGACPCATSWAANLWCSCQIHPESDSIIFHVHGGGFVSQTSKSHLPYLKRWSSSLGVPILSVDYTTAPEASHPVPLQEVLYAYCWMRNNFRRLGTTGNKVIVAGDSAGGNMCTGLVLQCIQLSLPKPDHLLACYPSLLCQMYPSPSRLICMLDPLVMFPCLLRCLNAYADNNYKDTCPRTFIQEIESCQTYTDPLLSPLLASDDLLRSFPPTTLISTNIDPCLDETVAFSNKLVDAKAKVTLEVFNGLPHGFLSLSPSSKDCSAAVDHITERLRDIILS